mgnify:CR=1 FL=1
MPSSLIHTTSSSLSQSEDCRTVPGATKKPQYSLLAAACMW